MVNNDMNEAAGAAPVPSSSPSPESRAPDVDGAYKVALAYAAWTALTIVALVIFSFTAPSLATSDAWGHAIIVVIFAFVLPLRLRAVRKNPAPRGVRAAMIIASVLLVVNVVEALLPMFPDWMRGEMTMVVFMTIAILAMLGGAFRERAQERLAERVQARRDAHRR